MIDRRTAVSHYDIESLDASLAWIAERFNTELSDAKMVEVSVNQRLRNSPDGLVYKWIATISGTIEEAE
jgi:hypothetical protein